MAESAFDPEFNRRLPVNPQMVRAAMQGRNK
jgi:hypothetical protein